ncbi:MAG: TlpA family protein disulfide reductase [Deltaproteobacteria bacterium]|nr:TlpA family protein disulfide reductase [Deltaproteobacteria bacterium]
MNRRIVLGLLTLQAVAVLAYGYVESMRQTGGDEPPRFERVDGPSLPPASLLLSDGSELTAKDLLGKRLLLHFWSTSCPPCREELPKILGRADDPGGPRVLAVAVDEDWATVREFLEGSIPPSVVRDPSGAFVRRFEVGPLPDTYLIDATGTAKLRFGGARDWSTRAATDFLASPP